MTLNINWYLFVVEGITKRLKFLGNHNRLYYDLGESTQFLQQRLLQSIETFGPLLWSICENSAQGNISISQSNAILYHVSNYDWFLELYPATVFVLGITYY